MKGVMEKIMCSRCEMIHRWGPILHMGRYREADKMTFVVPSVTPKRVLLPSLHTACN